ISCLFFVENRVPSGLISVMPQACLHATPYSFWNASIMAGGHAEPPTTTDFSVEKRSPLSFAYASRPSHTLGTPAEAVTFSRSNSPYRLLPSRPEPGNTSFAPFSVPKYGMPQALTWNIGTTGRITERAEQLKTSGSDAAYACRR